MKKHWEATLITAAILLILAALAMFTAYDQHGWPIGFRLFLVLTGVVLAALAIVFAVAGAQFLRVAYEYERALVLVKQAEAAPEAAAARAQRELVIALQASSPVVLDILANSPALARAIAGNHGPLVAVETKNGPVPYGFIDEWMTVNFHRADQFRPVRAWEAAGRKREYASRLERHLIDAGLLVSWDGNRTARWASPQDREEFIRQFYGSRIHPRAVRVSDSDYQDMQTTQNADAG